MKLLRWVVVAYFRLAWKVLDWFHCCRDEALKRVQEERKKLPRDAVGRVIR